MCFHLNWLDLDEGLRRIRCHLDYRTTIVLLLCCFVDVVLTARRTTPSTAFRQGLMRDLMRNYEQVPPPGGATVVELGVYINSFYAISEQTMDYSLSIYLRQRWNDSRLQFDVLKYGPKPRIKLEDNMWTHLWTPDVFFRNEKKASFHTVTTPNRLIFLYSMGTLWYVVKITTTLSCPMKLQKYPFDTQECPMIFESFGYKTDTIVFKWLPSPVEFEPGLELPQFFLVNYQLKECNQNSSAGLAPCLSLTFTLKRNIGYYMIQLYIPSILIVILSWVSFWLNIDAAPARVSIGLLTVLTTTTMSTAARDQLPRVSYIKAIDVWMSACLLFVFSSFLEYAVVSVFSRKRFTSSSTSPMTSSSTTTMMTTTMIATAASTSSANFLRSAPTKAVARFTQKDVQMEMVQLKSETMMRSNNSVADAAATAYVLNSRTTSPTVVQITRTNDGMGIARRIDQISRKVFPITFVTFNLVYWIVYNVNFNMMTTT